jgi:hypothetical protein
MDIPQIQVARQKAEIAITSTRAKMDITSHRPQFRLIKNDARMSVDRRLPRMHVDRSEAEMMLSRAPVLQTNKQYYLTARQNMVSNIASIAAEGTALMRVEDGVTLADIAAQEMEPLGDLNISAMPKPDIDWEKGYLNIDWTPGNMRLEWDVSTWVDIRVEPHSVEIRLAKHPEIRITVKYKNNGQHAGGKFVDKYL